MPVVSVFFGIVIRMCHREHEPPHFRAEYGGNEAVFGFDGTRLRGALGSRRAERLVRIWARESRAGLETNWRRAAKREPMLPIPPLE